MDRIGSPILFYYFRLPQDAVWRSGEGRKVLLVNHNV